MKTLMMFGMSFAGVCKDAREAGLTGEELLLLATNRDKVTADAEGVVRWHDQRDDRDVVVETGARVTVLRLPAAQDGQLDLADAVAAIRAFAPDVVIINGGVTEMSVAATAAVGGTSCQLVNLQRDGQVVISLG